MAGRFPFLKTEEETWGWAKRLVEKLNKSKVAQLDDIDLTGKGGYTVKVKADASGFELVP